MNTAAHVPGDASDKKTDEQPAAPRRKWAHWIAPTLYAAVGVVVVGLGVMVPWMMPWSNVPPRHDEAQAAIAPPHPRTHPPILHGLASWYGDRQAGRLTASGAAFDPSALTAAHRTLPLGTQVRVSRVGTPHATTVTITDRGPYVHGRVIDLSPAAANALAMKEKGLVPVRIEVLNTPKSAAPKPATTAAKAEHAATKTRKSAAKAAPARADDELAAAPGPSPGAAPKAPLH